MPIYEYEREDGTTFDAIQKMTDPPLEVCPTTGKKVKRLMSASTAIFNGSGFYQTDYCNNKSSAASAKTSASSNSSSESGSSTSAGTDKNKAQKCGSGCGCH